MLSDKDLIFLGACMLLSHTSGNYITENEINVSIESSKEIFNRVFCDEDDDMILE